MSKHHVTVEDGVLVEFICEDDHGPCHTYPGCECEEWGPDHEEIGPGHRMIHHDDCWMQWWFDNPESTSYWDTYDVTVEDGEIPYGLTRSGYIETDWEDCVVWNFIKEES